MSRFAAVATLALVAFACTANAGKTYSGTPQTLGVTIDTGANTCDAPKVSPDSIRPLGFPTRRGDFHMLASRACL